jgi:hypothetical protein
MFYKHTPAAVLQEDFLMRVTLFLFLYQTWYRSIDDDVHVNWRSVNPLQKGVQTKTAVLAQIESTADLFQVQSP